MKGREIGGERAKSRGKKTRKTERERERAGWKGALC